LAGVDGSSIPVFSSSFVNPSPSQSADFQAALGVKVWLASLNEHGSLGSVPSIASCASVTPSPSVSLFDGSVILPFGFAGVDGSSIPVFSSLFVKPSPSQSALFQAVLVATV
jgi:hypothetical protein